MTLSYKVEKKFTEVTTHELKAPKGWSCYSGTGGNAALHSRADRFIQKIEKINALSYSEGKAEKMEKAFLSFMRSYDRFKSTKVGMASGATDTAVRECVWAFLEKAGKAVGIDYSELDRLWERVF